MDHYYRQDKTPLDRYSFRTEDYKYYLPLKHDQVIIPTDGQCHKTFSVAVISLSKLSIFVSTIPGQLFVPRLIFFNGLAFLRKC